MTQIRQIFLKESANNLKILQTELAEDLTDHLRREALRTIHTVKGGAQIFGLQNSARIAGELENILSNNPHPADKDLLREGIKTLAHSLERNETASPAGFIEKLQAANRKAAQNKILLANIPPAVFKNFSAQERNAVIAALREEKSIFCAEVGFDVSNFADRYRSLRKILGEKCEIIAALPSEKYQTAGKIGFRIFLASGETVENLQKSVRSFDAEISSHACSENYSKDLFEMLSQIAADAENIGKNLEKQINITILSSAAALSAEKTKAFFDILLHLVRNAVDHAIDRRGTIEVCLFDEPEGLHLSVADDGKGIDLQKVRARAVEKNLVSDDDFINERQTFELIFAPEFSTAGAVTEISGRGVGLDAVKSAVEKMNGKISVRNRKAKGAIFEIFVPRQKT